MAKHTQTICRQLFGHFLKLAVKGLIPDAQMTHIEYISVVYMMLISFWWFYAKQEEIGCSPEILDKVVLTYPSFT